MRNWNPAARDNARDLDDLVKAGGEMAEMGWESSFNRLKAYLA